MTTYRPITEKDLDELYAHPEAEKCLIPTYGDRNIADAVDCDCQMATNDDIKIYNFPTLHVYYQPNDYYIVVLKNAMFSFCEKCNQNEKYYFEIGFISPMLENDPAMLRKYIPQIQEILIGGGQYLFGKPDDVFTWVVENAYFADKKNNLLNDPDNS